MKKTLKILASFIFAAILFAEVPEPKIFGIDFYLINVETPRHFSFGDWNSRQHLFLRVRSGNFEGWGECVLSANNPDINLKKCADAMKPVLGKTPSEALQYMRGNRDFLPWKEYEALNMALWDICAKIKKVPAVKLLGLSQNVPVNGMFCILENDPIKVVERAEEAKKSGFSRYIKLKIFGNAELDCKLISALRGAMGNECFIVADANCGYRGFKNLKELSKTLKKLRRAGLDALEDPAKLNDSDMAELQKLCRPFGLSLIPDVNLRPAWRALEFSPKGMGDFYNLHPGCMGDLYDMAQFAKKISSWGTKIMIGDDSLIGPGCAIFQQIAVSSAAAWCEAMEKPSESNVFAECLVESPVEKSRDGKLTVKGRAAGWGLKVDSSKLAEKSARTLSIGL